MRPRPLILVPALLLCAATTSAQEDTIYGLRQAIKNLIYMDVDVALIDELP